MASLDRRWGHGEVIASSRRGRGRAVAVFVGVILGGCIWSDDDVETESATSDAPECTTICEVGVCQVLECDEDNVCVAEERPAGSRDDDLSGDCRGLVCDGEGSWDVVITNDPPLDQRGDCRMPVCDETGGIALILDQSDEPIDTRGDCRRSLCNEEGGIDEVIDDTDVPDDGLECTVDACVDGAAVSTPVGVNTACSSDGGSYCHPDGLCRPCPTYAECTNEASESNNTQASAVQLGTISDDDDDGGAVCGVLDGPGDVDWYVFGGEDKPLSVVNPTRSLSASANAKLCAYARCVKSGTSVGCFGESEDTAPQGQLGCCSFGEVTPTIECDGFDDSATIWIKVENSDALQCVEYELEYHF